jgi:hypothetical protein
MSGIIGGYFGPTEQEKLYVTEEHLHAGSLVLNTQAAPITISKTNSAWSDFSNMITEICSAGAMSTLIGANNGNSFDVHWAILSSISAAGEYELALYKGASGSEIEIARVAFNRGAAAPTQSINKPIITERMDKVTRISAALTGSTAVANTVDIKLEGHAYDDPV